MLGSSLLQSAVAAWALLASSAVAVPYHDYATGLVNTTDFVDPADSHLDIARRQAVGSVPLRILTLGASIVYGYGSSDQNGFRKKLRDQLRYRGWEVNMVGSKRNGNMVDNVSFNLAIRQRTATNIPCQNVEANPGDIVDQVHERSSLSYGYKPNVVMINAGTNDCTRNIDVASIGDRMRSLISDLWAADGMSNTLILLSHVLPNWDDTCRGNRATINAQYTSLARTLRAQGRPIAAVSMDYMTEDDLLDGTHPTDYGYVKMANVWWTALEQAALDDLIPPPAKVDLANNNMCDKAPGAGTYAGGLTQRGSGVGDGIYYHESQPKDVVLTISSGFDRGQWFFARLYGRARDDLVGWFDDAATGAQHYGVWKNNGDYNTARFDKIADMTASSGCIPRGVRFVDLNADGFDDFVCINAEGNMYAGINQRDGTASAPPTFRDIGLIKTNEGYAQDRVRLADIDGDGRADYCVIVDDAGNVRCWRNGWVDDAPAYWEPLGIRFQASGDIRGIRFEDLNGDGRDDALWVSDVGATTTWTNSRSCAAGAAGNGLNVAWRQGFLKGASSGPTHGGMAGFVTPTETYLRDRIHFARIFGEPQAFGLLGRQDYVFMEHVAETNGLHTFRMRVWKNIGAGSTKLEVRVYPNIGLKQITGDESFWGPVENDIWDPVALIGRELDRRDIHLVDWDGDGACDIVWVDPDNSNRVSLWINKYPTTKTWTWDYRANPAPALSCAQSRGLGIHDLPVRFGDISGNGRGDYLCIEKNGRVSGFVHNSDDTWENVGQVKFTDGMDRADLRWSDVNGDGKDDMVWVDKFTGDGTVFYNRGRGDPAQLGGSSFSWDRISGPLYEADYAGTCQYLPDLDGDGRADLHSIIGTYT
ncbi:hypothetical protein KJ359_009438 [Pestalotiopsis sp. 9143b]|nr:hypothetical protein KJ359_009438 [Pestalotiopsis sp. 9143b]